MAERQAVLRVSGRPLGELLRAAKNLPERMALLRHIIDVCEAIAYAHSMRILHRDLKPSNVAVGEFGETVVIDWGLAKDISDVDRTADGKLGVAHTVQGAVVGTPGYMPPEQAFGRPVDERADVFALGSLLYTVLAGRPPYEGSHPPDLVLQVKAGAPVPPAERDKAIPPDLCAIVAKAMARHPPDRYATARDLVEDLKRNVTGQLVAARACSRTELVRRWIRRNRFGVAFAPDGKQLATASVDGTVRVWTVGLGEPQVTRLRGRPATFAANADGTRLARSRRRPRHLGGRRDRVGDPPRRVDGDRAGDPPVPRRADARRGGGRHFGDGVGPVVGQADRARRPARAGDRARVLARRHPARERRRRRHHARVGARLGSLHRARGP